MKRKKFKKFFEIKKKDVRVGILLGIIVGAFGIFLGYALLYYSFVGTIGFGQRFTNFIDTQETRAYDNVANSWQEAEFVKSLSYICSFKKSEVEKVECVYYYVRDIFNYTIHGIGNQLRRNPEEAIIEGMVCRDSVVLYASLMKCLNIRYEFIKSPGHIYLQVYPDNYSCKLDMDSFWCDE